MPLDNNGLWYSVYESWYPAPKVDKTQSLYLNSIEEIYKIENALNDKLPSPYLLSNHQAEFHLLDATFCSENALHTVVVKSRGTSFTTSSIIRILNSLSSFKNKIIPLVRLNKERAIDLIKDFKRIIELMTPWEIDGNFVPFDPKKCNFKRESSIRFEDLGIEIRAFPATAASAESIRGERIIGVAGLEDEVNFIRDFKNLYTAHRDTKTGANKDGKSIHQITIGTTRKDQDTPFNLWFEDQEKKQNDDETKTLKILKWNVFEPNIFKQHYNKNPEIEIPFHENKNLIPIVPWHSKKVLWKLYNEDINTFYEEYMAFLVDKEEAFYPTDLILRSLHDDMPTSFDDFINNFYDPEKEYIGGTDVASIHDFYVNTIFEITREEREESYKQIFIEYKNKIELAEMEDRTDKIIETIKPTRWRIDANGIGLQISQNLIRKYGQDIIDPIKGGTVKNLTKRDKPLSLNEYLHTNMKKLMTYGKVKFLKDEMLIRHYKSWDYKYNCASSKEYGHGDIVMANGYALLPENFRKVSSEDKINIVMAPKHTSKNWWEKKIKSVSPTSSFRRIKV